MSVVADIFDAVARGRVLAVSLFAVQAFIRRYVVLNEEQATAVTLWVAHTHVADAAECTPYLQVTSATMRAGKTRLLEVVEPLVATPWFTGRTTAAALVRKVDREQPTLLLDESDAAFHGEKEYAEALRAVLNSGYRRSGKATVCVGQGTNIVARDFATYGPKAIAGIGTLPGTIADRAIPIALKRRRKDEPCERWRQRDGHVDARPLRDALVAALRPFADRLRDARPTLPTTLGDRQADVWEALFAIADAAGNTWPADVARAATVLGGTIEDDDITVELLTDIRDILATTAPSDDTVMTATLIEQLVKRDDRPWATWRKGEKPLTPHGLRRLLKPLDIHPDRHTAQSGERSRGYRREAFEDAFARYLPIKVSKCPNPNNDGPELAISKCPEDDGVDTSKNAKTPIDTGERTHGHLERPERGADGLRLRF